MSAHALIVEPFETLAFMRAALVACLALALTNGAVGTLLVLRRMSVDGDVLGHAVMPGAAVGFLYAGPSPTWLSLGGLASGVAVAALAGLIASGATSLLTKADNWAPCPGSQPGSVISAASIC